MKKYILIIVLIFTAILFGKEASAASEYYNLIDTNQIECGTTGVFYSKQKIELTKSLSYTFVASSNFFGTTSGLNTKFIGVIAKNAGNADVTIKFKLNNSECGLYYATVSPTDDCVIEFTDFLTKGYDIDTLPKEEVILYKGTKSEFKGFRKSEYINNYKKAGESLDIYTSCNNPIKTEDITSKIKCYDNDIGFYNEVVLMSDNYNNTTALGDYSLVYKTVDKSNNENTLTVNVRVVDNEGPVIIGPDIVEWDCYTTDPMPDEVFKFYSVYDNVDGNITDKLKTQTFIMFLYEPGVTKDYEFILSATDSSGNKTLRTITIKAYDMLPPELTVKDININLSTLGQSLFSSLFEQTVESVMDYSGTYTLSYDLKEITGKMGFSGNFELTVTATDPAGNKTEKKANIKIIDDIAPEFYLYVDLLNTTTEEVYTLENLKEVISNSLYEDGILYDSINLISCDYITNEKNPGKYEIKYAYTYKDITNYVVGTINVTTVEEPKSPVIFLLIIGIPAVIGIIYAIKKKRELY